jgi:hypothetical protein
MRKIARRAVTAGAVAATAIALTAMPASADIIDGGDVTATNENSIIGFGNINGSTLECTSSTATGNVKEGSPTPSNPVATLNSVTFSSPGQVNNWCVANGSIPTQVTASNLPWTLDRTGTTSGGVTPGQLKGIVVTLHAPSVPCDATVGGAGGGGGTIDGTYTNPTSVGGNNGKIGLPFGSPNTLEVLSVSSVTDCAGLISVGETVSLAGTYTVVNDSGASPTITP